MQGTRIGSILTREESTRCRATKPEHRSSCPVPRSPGAAATKPVCCNQRSPHTSQEEPPQWEARAPQGQTGLAAARGSPRTATEPKRSQEIINKDKDIGHEHTPSEKSKHSHRLVGYKLDLWHENSFEHIICEQLFKWQEHAKTQGNHQRDLFGYLCFPDHEATEHTSQVNVDNSCATKDTEPFRMRAIWPYLHIFKLRFNSTVLYFPWSLRVV